MPLLTLSEAREAGRFESARLQKSVTAALNESARTTRTNFDIFLSHSRLDGEVILGVKRILERSGKTVYVDWIDDPQLDRSQVTAATAEQLRVRMRQCQSLFYAHSGNASKSRWMPWELGYYDGFNGNVAILPLMEQRTQTSYKGEEYLGVYPYVDVTGNTLYIHRSTATFRSYDTWKSQADKLRPST